MDKSVRRTRLDRLTEHSVQVALALIDGVADEEVDDYFDVRLALDAGIHALAMVGIHTEAVAVQLLERAIEHIASEFTEGGRMDESDLRALYGIGQPDDSRR
jgi:hypothetical protein